MAQQPPIWGNPEHAEPPEGWHCQLDSPIAPAEEGHACVCHEHRECIKDEVTGKMIVVEHESCRVWCYKDHCRCPVKCSDTE